MENVWQTVLAILASFGGAGVIILAVGKWLANITADRILKKVDFEYQKRIESLKSNLEKKNYISRTRFDLEIEIYRQISEKIQRMVFDNNNIFTDFSITLDSQKKNEIRAANFQAAQNSYNEAQSAIYRNAAFIPKELSDFFLEISKLCRTQLGSFMAFDPAKGEQIKRECNARSDEINAKLESLIELLRGHIASLDVLDKE